MSKSRRRQSRKPKDKESNASSRAGQQMMPFWQFMKEKNQRLSLLGISGTLLMLFFLILKTYPYIVTTPDTGTYVLSAKTHVVNAYRPMGYSWFIDFFHGLSESVTVLFAGQFVLHALAVLAFIFSVQYFFRLPRLVFYGLSALIVFSPSLLYSSNMIMSDTIFHSLTLIYMTTGLWILRKPHIIPLVLHLVVLYLAINVRYTALFYPFLSVLMFLLNVRRSVLYAVVAVVPIVLAVKIYGDTKAANKEAYGFYEFSAFGGWAAANNAISIIPHIDLKASDIADEDLRVIHQIVTSFPDTVFRSEHIISTAFMWTNTFPGKRVLYYIMQENDYSYVKAWVHTGRQLADYASYLVRRYPLEYLQYYILPNIKQLFLPYDLPKTPPLEPDSLLKEYFGLEFDSYEYEYAFFHWLNPLRKVLIPLLWIMFLLSVVYLIVKRSMLDKRQWVSLGFLLVFVGCYAGFSIIAHPINNFRYMMPIYGVQLLVISLGLGLLLSRIPTSLNPEAD